MGDGHEHRSEPDGHDHVDGHDLVDGHDHVDGANDAEAAVQSNRVVASPAAVAAAASPDYADVARSDQAIPVVQSGSMGNYFFKWRFVNLVHKMRTLSNKVVKPHIGPSAIMV